MKALSQRPMINLIRRTYFLAAAVSLFASLAVTASMLIAGRAPQSVQYWTITIAVSLFFIIAGLLLLGIGHHLSALGTLAHSMIVIVPSWITRSPITARRFSSGADPGVAGRSRCEVHRADASNGRSWSEPRRTSYEGFRRWAHRIAVEGGRGNCASLLLHACRKANRYAEQLRQEERAHASARTRDCDGANEGDQTCERMTKSSRS